MSSSALHPGSFNHIALPTADPETSARFYDEVLGFRTVSRPSFDFDGRWLYREGVSVMIHLIHVAAHRPPTGPIQTRGHHFAMHHEDVGGVVRQLRAQGVEHVESTLPDHGFRQVFLRDPDGNVIELGEWPEVDALVAQLEASATD